MLSPCVHQTTTLLQHVRSRVCSPGFVWPSDHPSSPRPARERKTGLIRRFRRIGVVNQYLNSTSDLCEGKLKFRIPYSHQI
jgi:hypothetical protein